MANSGFHHNRSIERFAPILESTMFYAKKALVERTVTRFVLRQAVGRMDRVRVGENRLGRLSIQRISVMLCALVLLLVTLWGNVPAFARDEQRQTAQVSPLETPMTVTNSAIITGSLNAPTSPLTTEVSGEATVGVTTGVTAEATAGVTAGITSVITTAIHTATLPTTNTAPVLGAPTVDLVNRGQASLWLVGAVLVGLLVVIVVVIRRQR